jgi:hypothetical protein
MCNSGLLIVARALLSIALTAGCPSLLCAADDCFDATFEVVGGAHRMFREGIDHPALKIGVWSTDHAAHEITARFQIEDIFGNPVPDRYELTVTLSADGKRVERTIPFETGPGYFSLHAQFESGTNRLMRWLDLGVIPPPFPGVRPNSLFASNTAGLKEGEDLDFLQAIGMRV